jgi:DNA-binding transcriptional LysR family regulator
MISLEHWQALIAVADNETFAKAAEAIDKSQSTLSYSIRQIERRTGVSLFTTQGRRAILTVEGEQLVGHARELIGRADRIENLATQFALGAEAKIRVRIEAIYPSQIILEALNRFSVNQPQTKIDYQRSVLSGSEQALLERSADIVIGGRIPPGFIGESLGRFRFIAAAAPSHQLHKINTPITLEMLQEHRQLVVRDTGIRNIDAGWLGANQRWTLDSPDLSIQAAIQGLGFAWYAEALIAPHLNSGELKPLNLVEGNERFAELYIILTHGETSTPGVKELARLIRTVQSELGLS